MANIMHLKTASMVKNLIWCVLIVQFSCASYNATYDIRLSQVNRPEQAEKQFGPGKIIVKKAEGRTYYSFEDDLLHIDWGMGGYRLLLSLKNNSRFPLYIVWDESAFMDTAGKKHRVLNRSFSVQRGFGPQKPARIEPHKYYYNHIIPLDRIKVKKRQNTFETLPILPINDSNRHKLEKTAGSFVGKQYRIFMSLRSRKETYIYEFVYDILAVRQIRKMRAHF